MAGLRVHFVFPAELVERVDAALVDGQSRGEFVRRAVEKELATADRKPVPNGSSVLHDALLAMREAEAASQALSEAKEPVRREQADPGSVPSSEGVRSAAPAEQPRDVEQARASWIADKPMSMRGKPATLSAWGHVPDSSVAKRDVRPIPKAGEK